MNKTKKSATVKNLTASKVSKKTNVLTQNVKTKTVYVNFER